MTDNPKLKLKGMELEPVTFYSDGTQSCLPLLRVRMSDEDVLVATIQFDYLAAQAKMVSASRGNSPILGRLSNDAAIYC